MHNRSLNLLTRCLWSLSQVIVCCAHRRLHLFHLLIRANAAFGYPAGVFKSGAKASWPWSASNLYDPTANAVTDIASKDLVVSLHTPRPHHLSGGGKPGGPQAPPPPPIQRLLLSAWQPSAVGLVCSVRREGRDGEGARQIRHLLPWYFTGSLPGRSDCRGTHILSSQPLPSQSYSIQAAPFSIGTICTVFGGFLLVPGQALVSQRLLGTYSHRLAQSRGSKAVNELIETLEDVTP